MHKKKLLVSFFDVFYHIATIGFLFKYKKMVMFLQKAFFGKLNCEEGYMVISKMLKEIRENAGLSQEQFAEKLAISRQAVSKWERGLAMPDIENIMYISDIFNVSLDTIIKGDKHMVNKIISDKKNAKFLNRLFFGLMVTIIVAASFILFSGGSLSHIFHPVAILIIVFFPLLFLFIMYGKYTFYSFLIISDKKFENETWKKAEDFFNNYVAVLWLTVILVLSIDTLLLLVYLENREGLGPAIKFILNTIITAGLINLLIITPYRVKIKQYFIK